MKVSEAYPSPYLTASDLQGKTPRVTILSIQREPIGKEKELKPVIYFKGHKKGLVCNVTNAKTLQASYGDEMDDWIGNELILFTVLTQNQRGETVDGLRVRTPQPKDNPRPSARPLSSEMAPSYPPPGLADDELDELAPF